MKPTVCKHLCGNTALRAAAALPAQVDLALGIEGNPDLTHWALVIVVAVRTVGQVTCNLRESSNNGTTYANTDITSGAIVANGTTILRAYQPFTRYLQLRLVPAGGFDGTVSVAFRYMGLDEGESLAPAYSELPTSQDLGDGPGVLVDVQDLPASIGNVLDPHGGLQTNLGLVRIKLPVASGLDRDVAGVGSLGVLLAPNPCLVLAAGGIAVLPDPADALQVSGVGLQVKPASITPAMLNAGLYTTDAFEATLALTKAQILALRATPIQVVAAPGVGKMIEVVNWRMFKAAGAYDVPAGAGDDFGLIANIGAPVEITSRIEATAFINAAAQQRFAPGVGVALGAVMALDAALRDNQVVAIQNMGAAEFTDAGGTGSATITVKVRYRILDIA